MKKFVALFLAACLLIVPFTGCTKKESPQADDTVTTDVAAKPNPASDFEYEVNSDQSGITINKYIGLVADVVVPSHIEGLPVLSLRGVPDINYPTAVAEGVFQGKNIRSVVIPKTVLSIGSECFKDCTNLESVTIASDSALLYVLGSAFENCVSLKEMDLSSTQVKEIDVLAFKGCKNLKNMVFSNTLESIQGQAFYGCSSLTEVDLPESLTVLEDGAFGYCTSLKRAVIPTKTDLGAYNEPIFYHVPNMETIVFREGRESVSGYAIISTNVNVEIVVPASVKKFSPYPFIFNPLAQVTVTFLGDAPAIVDDFDDTGIKTIRYNPEKAGWESFAWKDKYDMQPIE